MPARARKANLPAVPRLNLIPPHIAAAKRMTAALIGTVVAVILILLGMGAWWQSNAATIARLEQDLQEKTRRADEVRHIQQQAQTIESGIKALSDRLAALDDIRQSGKQLAQLVRDISAWVPRGVRLTALQLQGGGGGMPAMGPSMPMGGGMGMPGAFMMMGSEVPNAPGMTPTAAGGTQVTTVVMHGYTTSLQRLRDLFSHLSQADLFSSVQLLSFEWQGRVYSGSNLQPVLPRPKPGEKTLTAPTPSATLGQAPALAPGGMGMPGGAPSAPMGAPGMGAHGGGSPSAPSGAAPSMGAPGMGAHGGGSPSAPSGGAPSMGAPGMGAHGGGAPSAPPMMMGPMAPGMAPSAGGTMTSAQFVRDPAAPRNAIYFIIQATLARPLQIATKLQPSAAAMGGGMLGMAPGAMPSGAMGPAPAPGAPGMEGSPPTPGAPPSGGAAPSTGGEAAPRGLGRRGAEAAGEE